MFLIPQNANGWAGIVSLEIIKCSRRHNCHIQFLEEVQQFHWTRAAVEHIRSHCKIPIGHRIMRWLRIKCLTTLTSYAARLEYRQAALFVQPENPTRQGAMTTDIHHRKQAALKHDVLTLMAVVLDASRS